MFTSLCMQDFHFPCFSYIPLPLSTYSDVDMVTQLESSYLCVPFVEVVLRDFVLAAQLSPLTTR